MSKKDRCTECGAKLVEGETMFPVEIATGRLARLCLKCSKRVAEE